jgi:uncharacterized protein YxjI
MFFEKHMTNPIAANYAPNPVARAVFPRRVRYAMNPPERPIAVRTDYIADSKKTFILRPRGDAHSAAAYRVTDEAGQVHFTASGHKFGDRSCREFRDASGLPLFELHRRISLRNRWSVTLPGGNGNAADVATGTPRLSLGVHMIGHFDITFENAAAMDAKEDEDRMLTLRVQKHGNVLFTFDVVDGNRKVAEIRESISHNQQLNFVSGSRKGYRPALDVTITPGVDMSLVSSVFLGCGRADMFRLR